MMDRTKWNQRTPTSWIAVTALLVFACFWVACGGGAGSANSSSWEKAITPPKLTGISPASGPTTGGTTVAITGTDFQQGATVVFGDVPAAKINSVTSTSIEAVTPVHNPGIVDVTVTNPDTRSDTLLGAFTFAGSPLPIGGPAPTISSALPNSGPVIGGTVVTITGTDFQSGATVTFGQSPAAAVVFSSATQLLATTPAHAAGPVDVIVRNPDTQSATVSGGFTYQPVPAPTISGLLPTSGPAAGGTLVTITGTNFLAGATVSFGGVAAASVMVASSTQIGAVTPPHAAGVVDVWVTNLDSQLATLASGFTYVLPPPTISGVSPTTGPIGGGTVVTITGTNFQNSATVTFAGAAATSVTVNSSTQIAATTPAHAAGTVDVRVTNPDNQSATLPSGFTFGTVTIGCGSDCGNVGDPYEGGSPPVVPPGNHITACKTDIGTGNWILDNDVGTDPAVLCLQAYFPGGTVNLDLGTHTVTGRVNIQDQEVPDLSVLMNGTIICNTSYAGGHACLGIRTIGRFHHLTVTQQNAEPLAAIKIEYGATIHSPPEVRLDHITSTVGPSPTTGRVRNVYSQTASIEADHNYIVCLDDTSVCQGFELGQARYSYIHHNYISLPQSCSACTGDSRGILFDYCRDGEASYNEILTGNNRAVRVRADNPVYTEPVNIHDNLFRNILVPGRLAAVHTGENDNNLQIQPVNIYNNIFQLGPSGNGIVASSASNVTAYNNTVTCVSGNCSSVGYFAFTDILSSAPAGSDFWVKDNDVSVLTSAGKIAVKVCGPAGNPSYVCTYAAGTSSARVCNTGTVVGNGTMTTETPPCP